MKKKFGRFTFLTAAAIGLSSNVFADAVGFEFGAYQWQQNYEGKVRSGPDNGLNTVDVEKDLGLDDESNNVYYFVLEHPLPFIPNVLLQHTELDIKQTATLTKSFDFNGVTYTNTENVTTDSDLTHTDLTLYYELLDNWVSLDVGLTIRTFSGGIDLQATSGSGQLDVDETLPMLYGRVKFDLPLTGLYVGGDFNAISYDDNDLFDYKINIGYESPIGLGIEGGLRTLDLQYEDNDDYADITIDGAYVQLFYHF